MALVTGGGRHALQGFSQVSVAETALGQLDNPEKTDQLGGETDWDHPGAAASERTVASWELPGCGSGGWVSNKGMPKVQLLLAHPLSMLVPVPLDSAKQHGTLSPYPTHTILSQISLLKVSCHL